MQFGDLTAKRFLGREGQDDLWLCQCKCGKEVRAYASWLRDGSSRACPSCDPDGRYVQAPKRTRKRSPEQPRRIVAEIGTRRVNSQGYPIIKVSPTDWAPEHRLVMEAKLDRQLHPGEVVRHKNGMRHDNRPENLELWTTARPTGQRISDLTEWAISHLREHAPEYLNDSATAKP